MTLVVDIIAPLMTPAPEFCVFYYSLRGCPTSEPSELSRASSTESVWRSRAVRTGVLLSDIYRWLGGGIFKMTPATFLIVFTSRT